MTGYEICKCLDILGHSGFPLVSNTDENTAVSIIMREWADCPYSSCQEIISSCDSVIVQVRNKQISLDRAAALASIAWRLEQAAGYRAIGEDDSTALAKYRAARAEIDAKYPQA